MITRRSLLLGAASAALASTLPIRGALAQSGIPSKGQLLFGYPPGAVGSLLGVGLTKVLAGVSGVDYALVNVEGRNTRLACEQVRNAPANGATLLHAQSTAMCLLPNIYRHLGYDPIRDFTPLGVVGEFTFSLTVGPLVPRSVTNLQQYLDWVKQNPDARDIGFSIYGSQGHLAVLTLAQDLSASVEPLAYKGTSMMIKDIAAGRLAAGFTAAGNGDAALWANGTLRSIGVTRGTRLPYWPNIMTLREQGVPDMDLSAWYAWYAPAATPADTVQQWRKTVRAMQASPDFSALHTRLLLTQPKVTVEEIPELITLETRRFNDYVKRLRLRPLD
jgi:tripartite-type tricarboxylate transporter receptor subunit TctC